MAWTETCKMDAVAQINKRVEGGGSLRNALRELSKESDIPYHTLQKWYHPRKNENASVAENGYTPKAENKNQPRTTFDLYSLLLDSGKKKILFGLSKTDDDHFLVIQEYRVAAKGKEIATKHRLVMPVDLFSQFRSALEQVEVLIQERCSGEPDVDVPDPQEDAQVESPAVDDSDHEEDDEVEPPDGDDGGDTQDDGQVATGIPPTSADGAEATTVEAEFVQCIDCVHFAVKKGAPEENGACNSRSGSWDGKVFQPPHGAHPCKNFGGGEPQTG
jgi:hypothetical protein